MDQSVPINAYNILVQIKISKLQESSCLSYQNETFTNISQKKVYIIQMLFQILMVASFTVITVNYVQLTSCELDERNDNFTNQYGIDGVHMRESKTLDG